MESVPAENISKHGSIFQLSMGAVTLCYRQSYDKEGRDVILLLNYLTYNKLRN